MIFFFFIRYQFFNLFNLGILSLLHLIYIYIYAHLGRRLYPKRFTLHSRYAFCRFMHSLEIERMTLTLQATCPTVGATGIFGDIKSNVKSRIFQTFSSFVGTIQW